MMADADKPDFIRVLIGLSAIKPGKELTREAYEIWWNAMRENWTLDEFRATASYLVSKIEFMPSPYHFDQARLKAADCTADSAWEELLHNHGECTDPVGKRALRSLGGWDVVGFADLQRLPWLKERFREAYDNFAESAEANDALALEAISSRQRLSGPRGVRHLLERIADPNDITDGPR